MKIFTVFICSLITTLSVHAQSIKRIEDPHIRAQQNRMVFKKWGEWLPKKKFFLGVQINVHHTMTWGWMAPSQNKRYMQGKDIRPLSPAGEQTQRMASLYMMKTQSDNFKEHSEELANTALSELYNHTGGAISEVDPLWQLYYKRMLRDVKDYNLTTFTNKLNPKQTQYLNDNGIIQWFDNEMQRLSERLNGAFNVTMDRGSRIINYHRIYLEYEKLLTEWSNHSNWAETLIAISDENRHIQTPSTVDFSDWENNDVAIMNKIIEEAKKIH